MGEIWGSNIETLSDSLVTIRNLEVEVRTLRTELRRIKAGVMVSGWAWPDIFEAGERIWADNRLMVVDNCYFPRVPNSAQGYQVPVTVYIVPREVE